MKIQQLLVLFCVVTTTTACGRNIAFTSTSPVSLKTVTPTLERTVTATLQPTKTAIPPRTEPTSTIGSLDPIAIPTVLSPTSASEPLTQNGPWLLLSQNTMFTGPGGRVIVPIFSNADGTAWQPVNLPQVHPFMEKFRDWWFVRNSKTGPFIAFQNYDFAIGPDCSTDASLDERHNLIVIFKLPENRIMRQFQLFGNQSVEKIRADECNLSSNNFPVRSPVLGVVASGSNTEWSPDGRYLAFAAALDQPGADLYLYDTQTDYLRRLTSHHNNPQILSWSSDGQTIIYMSVTKMQYDRPNFLESSGLYTVSISGTEQLLMKPNNVPGGLVWLSESSFVISDGYCNLSPPNCTTILQLFDLSSGSNRLIYSSPYYVEYLTDPIHHILFLVNPPAESAGDVENSPSPSPYARDVKRLSGLYRFDIDTKNLQPLLTDVTFNWVWDNNLKALRAWDWDFGPPNIQHTTILRFNSNRNFLVEKIDNPPVASPDSQWKVVNDGYNEFLQDAEGNTIQKLDEGGGCGWSPDSSKYATLLPKSGEPYATWLLLYRKENNWQPTLVRKITEGGDWWCTWIRP